MFGTYFGVVLFTSVRKTMRFIWFISKNIVLFEPLQINK